jgi:hypothetical protein
MKETLEQRIVNQERLINELIRERDRRGEWIRCLENITARQTAEIEKLKGKSA